MRLWGMNGRSEPFKHWPWRAHNRSPVRKDKGHVKYPEPEIKTGKRAVVGFHWTEDPLGSYSGGDYFESDYHNTRYGGWPRSRLFAQCDEIMPSVCQPSGASTHFAFQGGRRPGYGDYHGGNRYPNDFMTPGWGNCQDNRSPRNPRRQKSARGSTRNARGDNEPEVIFGVAEEPYEPSVQSRGYGDLRMIEWPNKRSAKSTSHAAKSNHHSVAGSAATTKSFRNGSNRLSGFH